MGTVDSAAENIKNTATGKKKQAPGVNLPSMRDVYDERDRASKNSTNQYNRSKKDLSMENLVYRPTRDRFNDIGEFVKKLHPLGSLVDGVIGGGGGGQINYAGSQALQDALAARQPLVDGAAGNYHQTGPISQAQAFQSDYKPSINMGSDLRNQAGGFASQLGGMQGFNPNINMSEQARSQAMGFANRLGNIDVPSTAMLQHRKATDRGMQQALSLAASSRNPRAMRDAMNMQAQLQSSSSLDSGLIRAQEQAANAQRLQAAGGMIQGLRGQDIQGSTAQNQMGLQAQQQRADNLAKATSALGTLRGQDIQGSTAQNKLALDASQFNTNAQNTASSQNASAQNAANSLNANNRIQQDRDVNANSNKVMDQRLQAQRDLLGAQTAQDTAKKQQQTGLINGLVTGSVAAFSDVNLKENIRPGDKEIDDFLASLSKSYKYNYKDSSLGEGDRVSPMAQDLERSEIGDSAVLDTPMGKMVDYEKMLPAFASSLGKMGSDIEMIKRIIGNG